MHSISEHNQFYLAEDRRQAPKEYFKFLLKVAAQELERAPRVLDIGCASGDFLYYLRSMYPAAKLTGMDVTSEFLDKARFAVPGADFLVGDVFAGTGLPREPFDLVFMSGVNYLFADHKPWLRNLRSLAARRAYVFGVFNPEDLDVRAMVQRSGDENSVTPWNLISKKTISLFLNAEGVNHRFLDWELPIPSPRTHEDPLRSWTVEAKSGQQLVVNGMQLIHRFSVLEIDGPELTGR